MLEKTVKDMGSLENMVSNKHLTRTYAKMYLFKIMIWKWHHHLIDSKGKNQNIVINTIINTIVLFYLLLLVISYVT